MSNKKGWLFGFGLSIIFAKFIPLASAAYSSWDVSRGPEDLVRIVVDFFTPFFQALLGYEAYDEFFFARVLLLLVVFVVVATILETNEIFKARKGIAYIIAAAVAILGARYMVDLDVIRGILLPYGAVTIAISIFIPFFVYFFFVHKAVSSGAGRKIAWILFAAVFFGLWWTRKVQGALGDLTMIYNIGIVAVIIAIIFDSKIHEYFGLHEAAEYKRTLVKKQIADVEEQLNKLTAITSPSKTTQEVIKHLEQRRSDLARKL